MPPPPPATQLLGKNLDGDWKVVSKMPKSSNSTGGNFSVSYIVEGPGNKHAFLKALDFSTIMKEADPARAMQSMVESFNFERDVLIKCKNERLDRVVTAITEGKIYIDGSESGVVQYLIFELADGDVRSQANLSSKFDIAWSLRSLHHIATGLQQLHIHGIAHQDLKPSNVLVFNRNSSKIGDFGRAAYKGHLPPHEDLSIPGDPAYAPPELIYNYVIADWNCRRLGCDAYLMGSMVVFFYLGVGMTTLIAKQLPISFYPVNWQGSFEEVLPYLKDAFQCIVESNKQYFPELFREDLTKIVMQLCEPDPRLRGNPRNQNQYSMERYISWFDRLARKAEIKLIH